MTKKEIEAMYFKWLCGIVYDNRMSKGLSYLKLLKHLHNRPFIYIMEMDENRYSDGEDLRDRFAYECGLDTRTVYDTIGDHSCSILEMMVALSLRCEEQIMDNAVYGDRTSQWFWNMIESLGLSSMTNTRYDKAYVDSVLDRFINREYKRNGEGGLFTIERPTKDLREIEIWYQLHMYLEDKE